ncbi:MAG: peptidoglycan editing factor PgeF [Prolixibacteraceae bacterium]|jgi:YfiH family protein|nr:peptidoglycan editing factor PgeF [Prolixibacteraceae bacterium]
MRKTNFGSLAVLQFDIFRKEQGLRHCITTKEGWRTGQKPRFSESCDYPWKEYRKELSKAMETATGQIYFPKQTHSDLIEVVTEETTMKDMEGKDALITNRKGLCIAVQTADCVPVLLFDPIEQVIGVVHAGWRGTVDKLVKKTIERMSREFGCCPENIKAGIGPSIYKYAYEVGEDVVRLVIGQFANYTELLVPSVRDGKAFFDLWEANRTLLTESGVKAGNIELIGMCSYELENLFFSARRDGANTGRMASCLMLN